MRDLLLEGLPVVDLLEVMPSTTLVARLLNCDQSSVSRTYRYVSDELELKLKKGEGGWYSAENNHNLLRQLRIASQQLRIVDLAPMRVISSFWNHGFLSNLNDVIVMPQSWLGVRRSLELLSSRVIDMAVCNGFEFLPNNWIYANGHWECGDLIAFELYRYPIELACHPGHPLVKLDALTGREFWSYPSVALPNELFPRMSQALIAKGLWQDIVQTKRHSWKHWEGLSRDRKHLVYTNCLRRRLMPAGIEIKVLPFDLDMMDVDVVVVSRSFAGVGSVQALFKRIKDLYVNLLMSGELNAQNS
jgi:DNA-binding transcriptional LysR family regulator